MAKHSGTGGRAAPVLVLSMMLVLVCMLSAVFHTPAFASMAIDGNAGESAAQTAGFSAQWEILLAGDGEYQSVQLNREIYNNMAADARDLRVLDQNGKAVAYFLYDSEEESLAEGVSFRAEAVARFVKDGSLNIDFEIAKRPEEDVYGNILQITMPGDGFAKEMTFRGSHDGRVWEVIAKELIYRVDGNEKMGVPLDEVIKYPFFRVTIPDSGENMSIDCLSLVYAKEITWKKNFVRSFQPAFTIEEEERRTVMSIPAGEMKNLKISRITIETEDIFKRTLSTPIGEDTLYHLAFEEQSLRRDYIEGYGTIYQPQDDEDFQIIVENGDDAPLRIGGITVEYACERVVFKREGDGPYYLAYGNPTLEKPVYDISSYAGYVLRGGVEEAALGDVRYLAPEGGSGSKKIDDTVWLNIVVGAASVVLVILIVKGARRRG